METGEKPYADIYFVGENIEVYGSMGTDRGIARFLLDDDEKTEKIIDLYYPSNIYQQRLVYYSNLSTGTHHLKMFVTGEKNAKSTSRIIDIDYFISGETMRPYAKVNFTGRGITIYTTKGPDKGIVRFLLDDNQKYEDFIDLFSWETSYQNIVKSYIDLPSSSHELKIEATGQKNNFSTGYRIDIDAVEIQP